MCALTADTDDAERAVAEVCDEYKKRAPVLAAGPARGPCRSVTCPW